MCVDGQKIDAGKQGVQKTRLWNKGRWAMLLRIVQAGS